MQWEAHNSHKLISMSQKAVHKNCFRSFKLEDWNLKTIRHQSAVLLRILGLECLWKLREKWHVILRLLIQWTTDQIQQPTDISLQIKEVRYSCSAHRSARFFIIAISSCSHKEQKQSQRIFFQYSCSVIMINIVKKYLWRKIHELNTLTGTSDDS